MQPANRGLISIDILRGLAAAGVFYYHQHIGYLINKFTGLTFFTYRCFWCHVRYSAILFIEWFVHPSAQYKIFERRQALAFYSIFKKAFFTDISALSVCVCYQHFGKLSFSQKLRGKYRRSAFSSLSHSGIQ
jgi:hypothetical protein